eukprot:2844264-Rhodomonas_salina.1
MKTFLHSRVVPGPEAAATSNGKAVSAYTVQFGARNIKPDFVGLWYYCQTREHPYSSADRLQRLARAKMEECWDQHPFNFPHTFVVQESIPVPVVGGQIN